MQKPFGEGALIDTIEDKDIYQRLQKFNVDIDIIKAINPTHEQIVDLLERLQRIQKHTLGLESLHTRLLRKVKELVDYPPVVHHLHDKRHVLDTLPHEYQKCMTGINQVLKICWEIVSKSRNMNNDNGQTVTMTDNKTVLQALALINDCNKYKMDLTTNGVVITDAIKFVRTNQEKLSISTKEENGSKENKEPDYNIDKDQLEEEQEEETGEKATTNTTF